MKTPQAAHQRCYNTRVNRHQSILVAMPTGSHSERMKLEGILQYAHEKSGARWNLELDLGGILRKLVRGAARPSYDGIIAYVGSDAERKSLLAINLPLVLIEDLTIPAKFPRRRNVVTLLCDHEAEGRTAAKYFLERQYRNFAYVGAEVDSDYNALRRKGFTDTVREAGFAVNSFSGATPLPDWIKSLPKPCALFAVHDLRARKVLAATEQAQVAVPSELAVLGVDDDAVLCTTSSPTLSSIPTFDRSLGYAAGRALNEIILGRAHGRVIRTRHTQVVTRHSTDTEAISDIFVAKALNWARRHLGDKLTAETLARHAGCSKHYLQNRTEQTLGTSLGAAVRRLRLSAAAELLTTTDQPVADIASRCGFPCVSHFAVLMRAAYGQTPLAYRKRRGADADSFTARPSQTR